MSDAPASTPSTLQKLLAELIGTFILVFGVIGTALYSAGFGGGEGNLNVGFLGVALALGLSVLVSAYAFGAISGGHFNPAVSVGLAVAGRFAWRELPGYVGAQVVGGVLAAAALLGILSGGPLFEALAFRSVSTGWDALSPAGFGLGSFLLVETIATAVFVFVILGVTSARAAAGFAPLAIGLTLTAIALVAIPVSNASFNPARSIATAVFGGGEALGQLWGSIVAPIAGAAIAALVYRAVFERPARIVGAANPEVEVAA
ncbi:aquaporin [Agromyces aurantiacus]|uniref:Aquaporin n=1 Tax=Agromyces aurantiacus TaxID=165814 RepID=A0ABV9R5V4_9MICO|nr:aquaporin [Agromyces aurantiacus]MBM7504195.1 aquaporin Z [Agromyces aurantiacus]